MSPRHRSTSLPRKKPPASPSRTPQPNTYTNSPTPPPSASPKTTSFSFSNLFRRASLRQRSDKRPAALQSIGRSRSAEGDSSTDAAALSDKARTSLPTPVTSPTTTKYPPNAIQTRICSAHNNVAGPSRNKDGESGGTNRLSPPPSQPGPGTSIFFPGHRYSNSGPGPSRIPEQRLNLNPSSLRKSNSTNTRRSPPPPPRANRRNFTENTTGIRRNRSLSERYAGDMTHRPLDMIKRDARAADRAPHMGSGRRYPNTDLIDVLDDATFGGPYHHGGPYDATLASRNTNPMYSPVAAVQHSNMKALEATPREFVEDSLERHMPLRGTATIPPGEKDFRGRPMRYEEGADLMREADAPGGAYGRWEGQTYHPDDLKGKGEPSYTFEKAEKEKRHPRHKVSVNGIDAANEFEMEPQHGTRKDGGVTVRQRSISSPAAEPGSTYLMVNDENHAGASTANDENGLRRSNTTGKRLSKGIKRRFGSIRRRGVVGDDE